MPTSIALSPHLEAFVREQVDAGRYNNVSEVVRDALRLLERRQQEDEVKLEALRQAVASGVAAIDGSDFTIVEPQDIGTFVSGLGSRATAGSSRRRPSRKHSGE
jgi:antitoxin ParD1/3/4